MPGQILIFKLKFMNLVKFHCKSYGLIHIKVANRPIYYKKAFQNGLITVNQLFELNSGELIAHDMIQCTYELSTMEYNALISAISKQWKTTLLGSLELTPQTNSTYSRFLMQKKALLFYYKTCNKQDEPIREAFWK